MSLVVQDLVVEIGGRRVVDGVSFSVDDGERVGLIGESGAGKSLTAHAVTGLLPSGARVTGSIRWDDRELVGLPDRQLAALRGRHIGTVFQEPRASLHPTRRVGSQVAEVLRIHFELSRAEARARAVRLLARVQLPDPDQLAHRYPHQLSGGQCQRVALAIALAASPELLVADEPTTALDVTVQAGVLRLLDDVVSHQRSSLLFVTHDIAVLAQVAQRAVVLAGGRVVQQAAVGELVTGGSELHPVARQLLRAARATSWRPPAPASAAPTATPTSPSTTATTEVSWT